MADLSGIFSQVQSGIDNFSQAMLEEFKKNIVNVFRTEAVPEIKAIFLEIYDKLADIEEGQMGPAVRGKDPLSLKNLRALFEKDLDTDLSKIRMEGDQLLIQVMDLSRYDTSNIPKKGDPTTVDVLGYYITGMIDEFAFITPEQYKARGRRSSKPLGRVGGGFLMPRKRYEQELWEQVTGLSFDDVKHSISGQRPFLEFAEAPEKIYLGKYIQKALEKTIKKFGGN